MKSIRHQLTRHLVVSIVALLGAGLAVVYFAVRHELVEAVDATLRARASAVAALSEFEQGRVQFDFSPEFLASYQAEHPRHYFEVRDAAGHPLARSPSLGSAELPWRTGGTAQRPRYFDLTLPNGRPGRATAMIFNLGTAGQNKDSADVALQIIEAADRTELTEHLERILAAVAGCGALLVAAVFWLVPRVLTRGLSPLETLGAQAERIDAHSLGRRFAAVELPAELQPIGRRLNDLLGRLQTSFERERRFSADLAHELRTPLSELRNLAECALKWPDARDPSLDRDVLAISQQMETLVTRMLALARGEHGQLAVALVPTDISAAVKKSWQAFAERAAARGVHASVNLASATVSADPVFLQSILNNLFDNAADYAPDGGEIRIMGSVSETGYALQIANSAKALTPHDVEQLFDRFWRKEAARTGGEHTGLGLNLARMFATAIGWTLTAKIESEGWLVFTLAENASTSHRVEADAPGERR